MDRIFEIKTTKDLLVYYYCTLISAGEEPEGIDQFLDYIDEHPELVNWFTNEYLKHNERLAELNQSGKVDGKGVE